MFLFSSRTLILVRCAMFLFAFRAQYMLKWLTICLRSLPMLNLVKNPPHCFTIVKGIEQRQNIPTFMLPNIMRSKRNIGHIL